MPDRTNRGDCRDAVVVGEREGEVKMEGDAAWLGITWFCEQGWEVLSRFQVSSLALVLVRAERILPSKLLSERTC